MGKKTGQKRLSVNVQTLRRLATGDLRAVQGGSGSAPLGVFTIGCVDESVGFCTALSSYC